MDCDPTFLLLPTLVWLCIWIFFSFSRNQNPKPTKLPAGPPAFPIIGNILAIGTKPHQSLTNFSKIYGSLVSLRLGSKITIVISSPDIAKDVLHINDQVFYGRIVPHAVHALHHHKFSAVFVDPSAHWTTLKRFCATNIFSSRQLDFTQNLWFRKLQDLLEYVSECCKKGEAVDIGEATFTTTRNSMTNTLFSKDLASFASDSSREFKVLVRGMMEEAGKPNIADFFPFLGLLDPQGVPCAHKNEQLSWKVPQGY